MKTDQPAKPPIAPVVVALIGAGYAVFFGFGFCVIAITAYMNPPDYGQSAGRIVPALLLFMGFFVAMQLPSAIGVLLHRKWGKTMIYAMTLGATISSGLGSIFAIANVNFGFGEPIMGMFIVGFVTSLFVAIFTRVMFQTAKMKVLFSDRSTLTNSAVDVSLSENERIDE